MKKLFILIAAIFLAAFGFTSCNQEDLSSNTAQEQASNKYSAQEAAANVLEFINNMNSKGTRAFNQDISIANIKPFSIENKTRASEGANTDTLFYIVNFNDSCGFAIASADKEDAPVLALIEHGNYNGTESLNPGFDAFMNTLIETHIAQVPCIEGKWGGGPSISRPDKFEVMAPLLKTKWGQRRPYNDYCPGPTGCVITAASQICSFLEKPNNIRYQYNSEFGEATINWTKVNQECAIDGQLLSAETKEQIARLMRFWGINFNAEYSSNSTSADTGDAVDKMRDNFGFNVTGLSDYNIDNVIKDLKSGHKIIIMRGNARYYHVAFVVRKYVDGHAWVVDGYIDQVKNKQENKYIHCNWGWDGSHNGYFLSDVLNAEQDPAFNDNDVTSTRSSNFRYRLKTATFTK